MAITFVDGQINATFDGDINNHTETLNANRPTGVVLNDFLITVVGTQCVALNSTPSGWIQLGTNTQNSQRWANTNRSYYLYYKIATSSEPSTYAWSVITGTPQAGNIADIYTYTAAYRSVSGYAPIVDSFFTGNSIAFPNGATSHTITNGRPCTLIWSGVMSSDSTSPCGLAPNSMANARVSSQLTTWPTSGGGTNGMIMAVHDEARSGFGAVTKTGVATGFTNDVWMGSLLGLAEPVILGSD